LNLRNNPFKIIIFHSSINVRLINYPVSLFLLQAYKRFDEDEDFYGKLWTEIQNATRLPKDESRFEFPGAVAVTESCEATEEENKLFNLAQTLFEGSFGEIVPFLKKQQISEEQIMRILIDQLIRFQKEQPEVFAWISQTEKAEHYSSPIGLFKYTKENDEIMDIPGHTVYWLEIHIPHANKLVTNLLQNISHRNMDDFFFGNNLGELKYNEDGITFGYVGQTLKDPRQRLSQHKAGNSGATLVEAIIKSYPERDKIEFRFCVISSNDPISDLAGKLELEPKVVTSVTEIIDINILRTANKYSCMGLNVEYGKSFGGASDAQAAGRGNLQFSKSMCEKLIKLFPDTGYRCQAEYCENALRLHRGDIYAYCQSCAGPANQTYIVARVVTQGREKTVVEAEDQMPKRDAERIRDYFCDLSLDAYRKKQNKRRGVPFAEGSLIKPIQDIVEIEGWKCDHPECKDKNKRRSISLQGFRWYISNWCNDHPSDKDHSPDHSSSEPKRKWRNFYLNVNTREWKETIEEEKKPTGGRIRKLNLRGGFNKLRKVMRV
jgi:hypothetical protein